MSEKLHEAVKIAVEVHSGQDRKYLDIPYIAHPLSVMHRVRGVTDNQDMLAAAILHDVLEDGSDPELHAEMIRIKCGKNTLALVRELTDEYTHEAEPDLNRADRKYWECQRLLSVSNDAKTIKLADLIDNSESILACDLDFSKVYMREKRDLLIALEGGDPFLMDKAQGIVKRYFDLENEAKEKREFLKQLDKKNQ